MRRLATAIAVVFTLTAPVGQPALAQDVGPLQSINDNIAKIIDPAAKPGEVQVSTLPGVVTWDDHGGRYSFYQVCDSLSAWGPTVKTNGISLSRRYEQYLLGINVVPSDPLANDAQLKAAGVTSGYQEAFRKEQDRILSLWNDKVTQERNVPDAMKTSYSDFMKNNGGKLAGLNIAITSSYGTWLPSAQAAAPSSAGRVLGDILSGAYNVKVKTYSGAELTVLECSPNYDITSALQSAQADIDAGKAPDLVLGFSHETGQINSSWSQWHGSGGWGPFSVSASHTQSNFSIQTNNFHLKLEFPRIIRFSLVRPWLDLNVVDTYKDTSIRKGSELELLKPLFGEHGSFALVSQEFVVAYKPRVTVKLDATDYSTAKSTYTGGGSISIGPFSVGGGASGGSSVEKWDDTSSEIVIGTGVNSFVILGVRNKVLP